jgi:hypothetical protein
MPTKALCEVRLLADLLCGCTFRQLLDLQRNRDITHHRFVE